MLNDSLPLHLLWLSFLSSGPQEGYIKPSERKKTPWDFIVIVEGESFVPPSRGFLKEKPLHPARL